MLLCVTSFCGDPFRRVYTYHLHIHFTQSVVFLKYLHRFRKSMYALQNVIQCKKGLCKCQVGQLDLNTYFNVCCWYSACQHHPMIFTKGFFNLVHKMIWAWNCFLHFDNFQFIFTGINFSIHSIYFPKQLKIFPLWPRCNIQFQLILLPNFNLCQEGNP